MPPLLRCPHPTTPPHTPPPTPQAQLDARGASDGDATRHLNVGTMLDTPALFAVAAAFGCVVAVVSDTADAPTLDDFAVGGVAARAPPRVDVVNPFALAGARVTLRCGAPPPTLMLSLQFKQWGGVGGGVGVGGL